MRVTDYNINEISNCKLGKYLQNFNGKSNSYTYLTGNFFLDGNIFLPIESKTFSTSLDLFSISNKQKYVNYFTEEYFNLLKNQTNNIKVLERCFIVGNDHNYCHNLIYWLPRVLSLIENEGLMDRIDYIVFNKDIPEYVKILIDKIFKIKKIKKEIILIDRKLYFLKNSYCPAFLGRVYDLKKSTIFWKDYREKIIDEESFPKNRCDYIYISREDSNTRKILNEDELVESLKKLNFKIISLSKLNVFDQINLFKNAKLITGYHGAGFVNIVFSKPKTKVIELFPNSKHVMRKTFEVISDVNNLTHVFYYIDYKSNKKGSINLSNFDGIVNVPRFRDFLNSYIE
ncbi:MAG: hypothetical protein CFH18_00416 [Alphaproteobacteria bacterium MarineAlpha5_Bin8]|nr:MAG: hypothetical protein CFH17_01131 [Alphaproteobacteria bacterium MarineAlpha5_Bin7]PPR47375.1 MAG: hypothetical protein CFH18_00416 [Alphaproteobacteria bacterium MarineAlpha5_Bin8]PPR54775.1 MAG: hypothetical protein CFH16_00224 [Alphaproteobacteria bacterium MarineAlpha5_Bin6]|tara:strand:+ start:4613 stop:5641 length:1029 start_codon:yes stop_codon:yes gene_type:complete